MKASAVKMILCAVTAALGTGLCASAQTSDYYRPLANGNARRIQDAETESRRNAAAVAAINAAKAARAERSRILAEPGTAEARRINDANRGR